MSLERYSFQDHVIRALQEDIGSGDLTSTHIFPPKHHSRANFIVKEDGVLCGLPVAREVFAALSPQINFTPLSEEGDKVKPGTIVAQVSGPTSLVLSGERVALNFMQRLSGIATLTSRYVNEIKDYQTRIVDTRKTLPGLRVLEKYAVRIGGGTNHRMGLYDAVMIKDNHIKAAGGIRQAVTLVRKGIPFLTPVEVEAASTEEALEAAEAGANVIMLDNMNSHDMEKAVQAIDGRAIVEASGGITFQRLREIAATGVDIISVGALTHSAVAIDISLKIDEVL